MRPPPPPLPSQGVDTSYKSQQPYLFHKSSALSPDWVRLQGLWWPQWGSVRNAGCRPFWQSAGLKLRQWIESLLNNARRSQLTSRVHWTEENPSFVAAAVYFPPLSLSLPPIQQSCREGVREFPDRNQKSMFFTPKNIFFAANFLQIFSAWTDSVLSKTWRK